MSKYLSPTIATVISQLEQTCDDLTRQELIRSLTDYTKRLCESDPELADILSEGKKTLPRCLRYVLEQAQKTVAKNVEAMLEDEFHALDEIQVRGQRALMTGAAIGAEQVYEWARAYYYGGDQVEPNGKKKIPAAQKGKGKDKEAVKKDTNEDSASDSGTKQTGSKKAKLSPSEAGQMTLEGFAA